MTVNLLPAGPVKSVLSVRQNGLLQRATLIQDKKNRPEEPIALLAALAIAALVIESFQNIACCAFEEPDGVLYFRPAGLMRYR